MSYKFITSLNSDALKTLNYEKLQHLLEAILGQAAGVAEVGGFGFPILEAAVVVELHVVRQHIKKLAPLNKKGSRRGILRNEGASTAAIIRSKWYWYETGIYRACRSGNGRLLSLRPVFR